MLRVVAFPAVATSGCRSVVLARLMPERESAGPEVGWLLLSRDRLSTMLTGEPSIGGNDGAGGVNLPDLLFLSGDDLGDTVHDGWLGGDTVHPPVVGPGGEVPHAELELEHEDVLRLCATGGVPMENWTLGGDMEMMSGAGDVPDVGAGAWWCPG